MTSVVAIIPARGGSIGLPGKNLKPLAGIPLVARSILAARSATTVSRVVVSSDDDGILDCAAAWDAVPLRRPPELSHGKASSESALLHAIDALDLAGSADIIVFLQCTSPFTTGADIDAVVQPLLDGVADSAFSVVEDHGFIWTEGTDGLAAGITHDASLPRQRRQDMQPRYRENGAVYAMRTDAFRTTGTRFAGRTKLVPIDAPSIEIDTPDDWRIAEAYLGAHRTDRPLEDLSHIRALVMDFDGVHTDDRVFVSTDGTEMVACSRSDGMGIGLLRQAGYRLFILSKEENAVVRARAKKLKIDASHGIDDKVPAFKAWCLEQQLELSEVAFIGNDVNDLGCMAIAGLAFAPADAHPKAKAAASHVLSKNGGRGALRELADLLLQSKS